MKSEWVAIVGSRDASAETLNAVRAYVASLPDGTCVVSGAAKGVDSCAAAAARERGMTVCEFGILKNNRGNYDIVSRSDVYGGAWEHEHFCGPNVRDALILRNSMIVALCHRLVAFPQGTRGGTIDAIEQAKRFRRKWEEIR